MVGHVGDRGRCWPRRVCVQVQVQEREKGEGERAPRARALSFERSGGDRRAVGAFWLVCFFFCRLAAVLVEGARAPARGRRDEADVSLPRRLGGEENGPTLTMLAPRVPREEARGSSRFAREKGPSPKRRGRVARFGLGSRGRKHAPSTRCGRVSGAVALGARRRRTPAFRLLKIERENEWRCLSVPFGRGGGG